MISCNTFFFCLENLCPIWKYEMSLESIRMTITQLLIKTYESSQMFEILDQNLLYHVSVSSSGFHIPHRFKETWESNIP